jgi:hypothetical protein
MSVYESAYEEHRKRQKIWTIEFSLVRKEIGSQIPWIHGEMTVKGADISEAVETAKRKLETLGFDWIEILGANKGLFRKEQKENEQDY